MFANTVRAPLWDEQADPVRASRPSPERSSEADVVIVGAGFTGLWTAYELLRRDRDRRVVVLEARRVGFGASGRNGGWCSANLPTGLEAIARRHGPELARQVHRTMVETVDRVGHFARSEQLDDTFTKGGYLHVARSAAQLGRLRSELASERALGIIDSDWLDAAAARARINATGVLGGVFTPHCAAVHPGRLVRGLAIAVERLGGVIHEGAAVDRILPHRVHVGSHSVSGPVVVRATEAYTTRLPGLRRALAPIYSLMVATEPLPPAVWQQLGWHHRETFNDARRLVIYGQRTADGRLAFGGRGAPYHWASRIADRFDDDAVVHRRLVGTMHELFPALAGAAITHRWGGPLGIARDWNASVGFDHVTGLGYAGGYVGDGVAASHLAGRTLAALIDRVDDPSVALPWVQHRSRRWEPEPLRTLAIGSALRLTASVDAAEDRGRRARWRGAALDRLTGG